MAYNTKKLYEQALKIIEDVQPYWIEQLVAHMPCVKSVFYDHFPLDSHESNTLKGLLENIRINACLAQDKKWAESDNATLQLAHRKLIGSDEDRRKLSQTYTDVKLDGKQKIIIQDGTELEAP